MPGVPAGLLTVLKTWSGFMKVHRFTEGIQTKARLSRFFFLVLTAALLPTTLSLAKIPSVFKSRL